MNDPKNPTNNFQDLCKNCGFCCDGTLFNHAIIEENEENEHFEIFTNSESGKRYFKQPCPYHNGICTLQLDTRASICSSFKCRVLKQLERGAIETIDASGKEAQLKQSMLQVK